MKLLVVLMISAKLCCSVPSDTPSFQGMGYSKCQDKVGEKEQAEHPSVILDLDCRVLRISG